MKKKKQKQKHTDNISTKSLEDQQLMNKSPKAERYIMEDGSCSCGGYIHHYLEDGQRKAKCGWCGTSF